MLLNRALWHIETHLQTPLTLRWIAQEMGVRPEYLTRSFTTVLGQPVMAYVRSRRLSRAAEHLARGGTSVIAAALDAGYGSPEAFARAFRTEFGLAPKIIARQGVAGLALTQAKEIPMTQSLMFAAPIVEDMPDRRVAGLTRRYTLETRHAIPGQWADYNTDTPEPDPLPSGWFGICRGTGTSGEFDYLCGVDQAEGGTGADKMTLPAGRYARFVTAGHISTMSAAWGEIYGHWMGQPGLAPADGPATEFYPPAFNGQTGEGGYEIWIPVL